MRRLAWSLACDVRVQFRNGFHAAAAFVAAFWILGLARVPDAALDGVLAAFVLSNLFIGTFYFVAGQVLLEKMEGTLSMADVTPLRPHEYLAAKAGSLILLAMLENGLIVLAARGADFRVLPLLAGIAAAGALLTLAGFAAVSRYGSINEFLFPSFLITLAFAPPFLPYLGLERSPWYLLHPLQAPLTLLEAAFRPVGAAGIPYGAGYSLLWTAIALAPCKRAFERLRLQSGSGA
jgi:fluoroquinolone transport system permease protein